MAQASWIGNQSYIHPAAAGGYNGKGKAAAKANFQPKRQRKAARKPSVRAALANRSADMKNAYAERAAFYRNLRQMKLMRRAIADEMANLVTNVDGLYRSVQRLEDRNREVAFDYAYSREALGLVNQARASVAAAASEYHAFSRRQIYFVEEI